MPPKGETPSIVNEGVQHDEHMRPAVDELKKAAPVAAPSGPAASGEVAAARAAQPPRGPVLAPARGAQDVKTPGEAAEEALRIKCPVGQGTKLSQKYKFPRSLRSDGDPNRPADWEQDWP
eukprot:1323515-Pyramimonas_sp.AAC.1